MKSTPTKLQLTTIGLVMAKRFITLIPERLLACSLDELLSVRSRNLREETFHSVLERSIRQAGPGADSALPCGRSGQRSRPTSS